MGLLSSVLKKATTMGKKKAAEIEQIVKNNNLRVKRVKEVDSQGYFEADDEVGSVFEKIKEITNELDNLKETN